jgi:hypothetical protein
MPKGPDGQKRPAVVIGNAAHLMRIATGQIEESVPSASETAGRAGGLKGGKSRSEALPQERRSPIAKKAAQARWKTKQD